MPGSFNFYASTRQRLFFLLHSIQEPWFRKVKRFVEGHLTEPGGSPVCLQSPSWASHCVRLGKVRSRNFCCWDLSSVIFHLQDSGQCSSWLSLGFLIYLMVILALHQRLPDEVIHKKRRLKVPRRKHLMNMNYLSFRILIIFRIISSTALLLRVTLRERISILFLRWLAIVIWYVSGLLLMKTPEN
jgi:hypothetical protein